MKHLFLVMTMLLLGCASGGGRCGTFDAPAGSACSDDFDYSSVVLVQSGAEREKVFRCFNAGSGVVVDPSGVIVTASHVVNGKGRLAVFVEGDRSAYAADVIADLDAQGPDLAFLRICGLGRRLGGGTVFDGEVPSRSFPRANLARGGGHGIGDEVELVGFPSENPMILRGAIVAPEPFLARYARERGLAPRLLAGGRGVYGTSWGTGAGREEADCVRVVAERIRQGCVFVELDESRRFPGISGGAIVRRGEVIGLAIESWNSFDRTILIGAPLSADRVRGLLAGRAQ